MRSTSLLALLLTIPALAFSQSIAPASNESSPAKNATVAGTVYRSDTNEPLKNAVVLLEGRTDPQVSVYDKTDEQGHFRIDGVPPGSYKMMVSHIGFLASEFGQKRIGASGALLTVASGQSLSDLVFKLVRTAAISGRVYNEDGESVEGAEVSVFRAGAGTEKERFVGDRPVSTNDLGEFRIFDLSPGRYYVTVSYRSEVGGPFSRVQHAKKNKTGYLPGYYPNTSDAAKAQAIVIRPGDEIRSIDLFLHLAPLVTVSGRIDSQVPGHSGFGVSMYPRDSGLAQAVVTLYAPADRKNGSFQIRDVPPGSYYLVASQFSEDSRERLSVRRELDVGESDIDGLTLTISSGVDIPGRLTWDDPATTDLQDIYVQLWTSDSDINLSRPTRVNIDGRFVIKNVLEGQYHPMIRATSPGPRMFIKSA